MQNKGDRYECVLCCQPIDFRINVCPDVHLEGAAEPRANGARTARSAGVRVFVVWAFGLSRSSLFLVKRPVPLVGAIGRAGMVNQVSIGNHPEEV